MTQRIIWTAISASAIPASWAIAHFLGFDVLMCILYSAFLGIWIWFAPWWK